MSLYEAMFVLDNDAVRAGWADAKGIATGILQKHGGNVHTARRWDERRLAYPIRGRNRGTYLLAYFEVSGDAIRAINRDLELDERVLRYLILSSEAIPAGEDELSKAEQAQDFIVPEPPPDEEPKPQPEPEPEPPKATKTESEGEPKAADKAEASAGASTEESKPALAADSPQES